MPAGRQVDRGGRAGGRAGVRPAEGTGGARALLLSLRSRAEEGTRGNAQKHPTHRAADGGERAGANPG